MIFDHDEAVGNVKFQALARRIVRCRLCPRLVRHREAAAALPPRRHQGERYWARPLPGFGDKRARVLVLGLAPAAHGGNRTGRIFTGDRSGDWLFAALWRAGLADQPESISRDDGLKLSGCYVTAAVRCAPPQNKPSPSERDNCLPYLVRELELLRSVRVIVCLGSFAWEVAFRALSARGGGFVVARDCGRALELTLVLLLASPLEHARQREVQLRALAG